MQSLELFPPFKTKVLSTKKNSHSPPTHPVSSVTQYYSLTVCPYCSMPKNSVLLRLILTNMYYHIGFVHEFINEHITYYFLVTINGTATDMSRHYLYILSVHWDITQKRIIFSLSLGLSVYHFTFPKTVHRDLNLILTSG